MPQYRIISSPGGSIQVVSIEQWTTVKDSNRLAKGPKHILGMIMGNDVYLFTQSFDEKEDIVSYLNSTFVQEYSFSEFRLADDGFIDYDNSEGFSNIEIMAIYETNQLIFKIGDPGYPITVPDVDVILLENNDPIVNEGLENKVLGVKIGVNNLEPSDAGYSHDQENQQLNFVYQPTDCYLYVLTTQIPE